LGVKEEETAELAMANTKSGGPVKRKSEPPWGGGKGVNFLQKNNAKEKKKIGGGQGGKGFDGGTHWERKEKG